GPTGSGKSTTLATLLDQINRERACHIITIEDPLEFVHRNQRSLVQQRELHTDVPSFSAAVRAALREDPDVILVGEMRDTATIRAATTAAETGHLVFSTLHTGDAVGTIGRIISVFPAEEQSTVREQLARSLRAVLSQRLIRRKDGTG
ncbi:MAG: Flp pilus assembly complex ATPase component TadA, partial [Planctomycetes bacterium]|nr:Flp pilus assembly complex ATPase component TadA [Planctomycetota bacterium]